MATTYMHYTVVRNISGGTMYFDWAGPRGCELANGADTYIPGDLFALWMKDPKKIASMTYALENAKAVIVRTPSAIGFDAAWGAVRRLKFTGGTATGQDLDTGSYAGSAPAH